MVPVKVLLGTLRLLASQDTIKVSFYRNILSDHCKELHCTQNIKQENIIHRQLILNLL